MLRVGDDPVASLWQPRKRLGCALASHFLETATPRALGVAGMLADASRTGGALPKRLPAASVFLPLIVASASASELGACPSDWTPSTSGRCFRLVPQPWHGMSFDQLPLYRDCPGLCGPDGAPACPEGRGDVASAMSLICPSGGLLPVPSRASCSDGLQLDTCIGVWTGAYGAGPWSEEVLAYMQTRGPIRHPDSRPGALQSLRQWSCAS